MNTAFFEQILYKYCQKKKKIREDLLNLFLKYYQEEFINLVKRYDLKCINDKYILMINNYDQNSYNKCKIRKEELFMLSILLLTNVRNKRVDDIKTYYDNIYDYFDIDDQVYTNEFKLYPFDIDHLVDFDHFRILMFTKCIEHKHFREVYIMECINQIKYATVQLIKKKEYSLISKKYLAGEKIYDNGYYFKKLKNEEQDFIKNITLLREWILYMNKYDSFTVVLSDQILKETQRKNVINFAIDNIISKN